MRRRDPTAMASANPHTANACGERREIRLLNRPCLSDSLPGTPRAGAAPMPSPPPTRLLPSPTGDGVALTYPHATPSSTFPTRSRRPYNVILMQLHPFALERYFARYEFAVRHLLSASDCDGPSLPELLALADDEVTSAWQALRLGYTESQGLPALRAEVAAWCLQTLDNRAPRKAVIHDSAGQGATVAPRSPALRADDVLLCAPEEGILLMMLALVGPHDHVVSIFPGYQSLYDIARGKEPVSTSGGRERRKVGASQLRTSRNWCVRVSPSWWSATSRTTPPAMCHRRPISIASCAWLRTPALFCSPTRCTWALR